MLVVEELARLEEQTLQEVLVGVVQDQLRMVLLPPQEQPIQEGEEVVVKDQLDQEEQEVQESSSYAILRVEE
jgi:hypothetical protein